MGMTSPTRAQLVARLTPTQADRLDALDNGTTDPATEELAASVGIVDLYAEGRTIGAAVLKAWCLDLAAYRLGVTLQDPNEDQKGLHDKALSALEAARDGKFVAGAPPSTGEGAAADRVGHGGGTNIFG
jgi:hypothetical protein